MAQNTSIEMLKKRLMAEFARDKKKAVILIVLGLVAVFFVGKLLLKSSPAKATAATNPTTVAPPGAPTTPAPGAENIAAQVFSAKNPKGQAPKSVSRKITRDIFMPDPSIFPYVKKTVDPSGKVEVVENAETKRQAELKRKKALIEKQAAELNLESTMTTMTGRPPTAIINGTVLGLDGVINGFRIVKIGSEACQVEKEGITVDLKMKYMK
jgi:hypothetical protein